MSNSENAEQVRRISEMEARLDRAGIALGEITAALDGLRVIREDVRLLSAYYESPLWREDFEADERGDLPRDIHRDALTEDAVYNLLEDIRDLRTLMNRFVHATARRRK